jgi:mercuric ion transport protein
MAARIWRQGLLAAPGIGVALLPKLACPLCWPLYAGIVSSLGLGFLISTMYLLPLTIGFLVLTLFVLAFRANQRRGHRPFLLGTAASATVLIGKFYLESNAVTYSGIGLLVAASVWNAVPRRVAESCPCKTASQGE